ncbi:abortive infection family protein [Serratia marcescens]|uniref:abortive infection family protein n=1 Tax=Serratia marcescens TaxID=615 RepID=UPI0029DDAB31|nr:abortive infection family protein [Serratia marcescens]MDX7546929.1 abortive infection family protein [Serratia marcescens]MDX7567561.1 abortive infection family protein [Serratia marcescens]
MRREIPQPIIDVVAEYISVVESHAQLNSLFEYVDAPGEPPDQPKKPKSLAWLRRINKQCDEPLVVLGKLVEKYMDAEQPVDTRNQWDNDLKGFVESIHRHLDKYGLKYVTGGFIVDGSSFTSLSLRNAIKNRDIPAVENEFIRAIKNIHSDPREAVSAACNIMESTFKIYIADEKIPPPTKQDLQGLWKVVRDSLGMDTKSVEDDDLKRILSGLYSITDGIGALRTHASSAHGAGRRIYNLKPRHARLAISSAHALTMFILESWEEKKQ